MKKMTMLIIVILFLSSGNPGVCIAGAFERGYGWHVDGTEEEAVKKSVAMMKKGVADPELGVLYTTVGYNTRRVMKTLRKEIGEKPKIFGLTSCWGVVTTDGVHAGEKASLAVLGIFEESSSFD